MPRTERGDPGRRPSAAEVEGFLAGVEHDLAQLRTEGTPDLESEGELARARDLLRKGERGPAAGAAARIDDRLRARRGESELTEFPRNLIAYVPRGDPGNPPGPEEDPLRNRHRLVLRLADLTPVPPADRERALRELTAAGADLARGDRRSARRRIDEAHRLLEPRDPA